MLKERILKISSNLLVIVFFVILLGINITMLINLKEVKSDYVRSISSQKPDTVYIEVPYVVSYSELEKMSENEAYLRYMELLTDENAEAWWGGYKIMTAGTQNEYTPISEILNPSDLDYLYRCVENEVRGGDFKSKANVANVIFNRVADGRYDNDITTVITKPNQFACGMTIVTQQTKDACDFAYTIGELNPERQGCLSFHSGAFTKKFNGQNWIFTDSVGHHFYR